MPLVPRLEPLFLDDGKSFVQAVNHVDGRCVVVEALTSPSTFWIMRGQGTNCGTWTSWPDTNAAAYSFKCCGCEDGRTREALLGAGVNDVKPQSFDGDVHPPQGSARIHDDPHTV
jgi:hypothetical protein